MGTLRAHYSAHYGLQWAQGVVVTEVTGFVSYLGNAQIHEGQECSQNPMVPQFVLKIPWKRRAARAVYKPPP